METIRIADIRIGDRRREDLGDIEALAKSIAEYGLLSPPVLTDDGTLVAGQRRVEAMKSLGWTETPFINKGELTDERLHEIELEENIRRKDFTEYEISKNMVALAEAVSERLRTEAEVFATPCRKNPLGGRPEKADATSTIAKELGVTPRTIERARTHVAAVETYPALEALPKMKAIAIAKQANKLPEEQRASFAEEQVAELRQGGKRNDQDMTPCGVVQLFPKSNASSDSRDDSARSDLDAQAAADTRAYNLTKAYNNTICDVMQLETTPEAVREWIRFSRMTRDEIESTLTDISVAIEHLEMLGETLSGCLSPQRLK